MKILLGLVLTALSMLQPATAAASAQPLDLTASGVGYVAIAIFVIAYLLVMAEEFTHLR